MRIRKCLPVLLVLLVGSLRAHAQSGCENSPECPTAVLALVGSAGAVLSRAYSRYKAGK